MQDTGDHQHDAKSSLARSLAFIAAESPDLAAVIDAWPTLPEAVKARIAGMIEAVRLSRP